MKHLKLFENFINESDPVQDWDWDWEEEENVRDIPKGMPTSYNEKDIMRIENIWRRSKNTDQMIRMAKMISKRITHIDKAWRRGLAAEDFSSRMMSSLSKDALKKVADIFYDRAVELDKLKKNK